MKECQNPIHAYILKHPVVPSIVYVQPNRSVRAELAVVTNLRVYPTDCQVAKVWERIFGILLYYTLSLCRVP